MSTYRNTDFSSKCIRVLFVHQGAELYGSDRSFERSVRGFRRSVPESHITVLLATHGPLVELLKPHIDEIIIAPLFVLRKQLLKNGALFNIPAQLGAIRKAMTVVGNYDAVYINTTVILDYIIACRLKRIPAILHVRELPVGFARIVLRIIVRLSGATVIFNSQATRKSFGVLEDSRHLVIANGTLIRDYEPLRVDDTLRILLIGRFNSWKGQGLLVTALSRMEVSLQKQIRVVMVGGVYWDQNHFRDDVIRQTKESGLEECIEFREFVEDPTDLYHWSSVVVVPSLLPEPFGLVAIEAMGHGRPVIAADHGGLVDIVVDGKTGFRFSPGDPEALAAAIRTYLERPDLVIAHGIEGRKRYEQYYHEDRYMTAVSGAIKAVI
ncbi:MAG: glycosyltransferase family 4 protein [Proteobacteria bacterium]|nr:glycosyltransferase family 4 protein [Pseudomonadota bacterium]MBU1648125.1 glycosyltransferase family 4 protein [Pseudomonadota bacterium]